MVFMCAFCKRALFEDDEQKGRRKDAKLKLTDDNFPACKMLLKRAWPQHASCADEIELGGWLCERCIPELERAQITRVTDGKCVVGTVLDGQPAARWADGILKEGKVISTSRFFFWKTCTISWRCVDDKPLAEDVYEDETVQEMDGREHVKLGLLLRSIRQSSAQGGRRKNARAAWMQG